MPAYYNEIDPFCVQWLRNLIAANLIAPGDVDERSIVDVQPDDLRGYTQCYFFAGVGVWSHALRNAGWPDDRPVWTGSCPCQPFSTAGRRGGFADERHLWPVWFNLIRECRPPVIFGEQVASPDSLKWLDAVFADLEGAGYSCGAADLCAAGVGAPHIRQRLYFVACSDEQQRDWRGDAGARWREQSPDKCIDGVMADGNSAGVEQARRELAASERGCEAGCMAHAHGRERDGITGGERRERDGEEAGRVEGDRIPTGSSQVGIFADAMPAGWPEGWSITRSGQIAGGGAAGELGNAYELRGGARNAGTASGTEAAVGGEGAFAGNLVDEPFASSAACKGFWADAEWIPCRDGKYRAVEPGTFPLAHGVAGRVGRLRAYGNAICAPVATAFIRAVMEILAGRC